MIFFIKWGKFKCNRFLNDLNNEKEKKQTFKLKSKPKLGLNYDKVIKKFS